jgi:hypothetical protein
MTILERRASTVFNRSDFNILEVMDLAEPTPKVYTPNDFFSFYDIILKINSSQPFYSQSSQYSLLFTLSNYLQRNQDNPLDTGGGTRKLRLQDFLSTPLAIFNDARFLSDVVPGLGTSVAMAVPGYRVCVQWYQKF